MAKSHKKFQRYIDNKIKSVDKELTVLENNFDRISSPSVFKIPQVDGGDSPKLYGPTKIKNNARIACSNARSMTNKWEDVENMFDVSQCDIGLFSETWETDLHEADIEYLREIVGVQWVGRPRVGGEGGGVAIAVAESFGKVKEHKPDNPLNLEVVWGIITPKARPEFKIAAAAFYSSSTKKYRPPPDAVQDHILEIMSDLREKYSRIVFVIGGDANHIPLGDLNGADLVEVIDLPTRKQSKLDVVYTDMPKKQSWLQPPLTGNQGNKSDHSIGYAEVALPPIIRKFYTTKRRKVTKKARERYSESLGMVDWKQMEGLTLDEMVEFFNNTITSLSDKYFPMCSKRFRVGEYKCFDDALKKLHREMKNEYKKSGNSSAFKTKKKIFGKALDTARQDFMAKQLADAGNSPKAWHAVVGRIGRDDCRRAAPMTPELPCFKGMSNLEKAEQVADSIEKLTADYEPINVDYYRSIYSNDTCTLFSINEVKKAIKDSHLPNTLHILDPPRDCIKENASLFALPLRTIFNLSVSTGKWPKVWKVENTSMIPKTKSPETLKQLRPIVITSTWSKVLEKLVRSDIVSDIDANLHPNQFGSRKSLSCVDHLSATLFDLAAPAEDGWITVACVFDFSSAFNRLNHGKVVEALERLGLRHHLCRLIADYLSERMTTVRWEDKWSSLRHSKGGSGQGTLLSGTIFIATVDGLLKDIYNKIEELELGITFKTSARLYCDDLILIISFSKADFIGPDGLTFHDPRGRLEALLKVVDDFAKETGMSLNKSKTAALVIDFAREGNKVIFPPGSLCFANGETISRQDNIKLLGMRIDSDLSHSSFVTDRRNAGMKCLWFLRRLRQHCPREDVIRKAYISYVRPVLEYAIPAVFTALDTCQFEKLEKVQKEATRIILGSQKWPTQENYIDYQTRLQLTKLEDLETRWRNQFEKVGKKWKSDSRFKSYFKPNIPCHQMSLRQRNVYIVPKARTDRLKKSAVAQAIELANRPTLVH